MDSGWGQRMCSRFLAVLGVFVFFVVPADAAEPGGNRIEVGAFVAAIDFDDSIRFENDLVMGIQGQLGFRPWFRLGVELAQMTVRDGRRDVWTTANAFAIRASAEPWSRGALGVSGSMGVSFVAFEESANWDAVSEGLDLGLGARWGVSSRWNLRGRLLLRLETFKLVQLNANGEPTGDREETGYLWSQLFRLELSHVF